MKRKQKQSLRDKSIAELLKLVSQKRSELALMTLKDQDEKNVDKKRQIRHEIAVLLTLIRQRGIQEPLLVSEPLEKVKKTPKKVQKKTVTKAKKEEK